MSPRARDRSRSPRRSGGRSLRTPRASAGSSWTLSDEFRSSRPSASSKSRRRASAEADALEAGDEGSDYASASAAPPTIRRRSRFHRNKSPSSAPSHDARSNGSAENEDVPESNAWSDETSRKGASSSRHPDTMLDDLSAVLEMNLDGKSSGRLRRGGRGGSS